MKIEGRVFKRGEIITIGLCLFTVLSIYGKSTANFQQPSNKDEIKTLILTIEDRQLRMNNPEKISRAIARLGELRAVEATEDLARLIAFEQTPEAEIRSDWGVVELHPITAFDRYPAMRALVKIGKASLPALIKVIENFPSGAVESENARLTISAIFRDAPPQGLKYLKAASFRASNPEATLRLRKALAKNEEMVKRIAQ